jgi:translation elongation factor P/translation initiation factor 5A
VIDKKTETNFDFEDRPYEFIDLESGEKVKVQAAQIKDHYRQYVEQYNKELKLKCGQYKIDFIEADIGQGFNQILYAYLIKRSKMR